MSNLTNPADQALIALLKENARASVTDLAQQLKVSRTTVQNRLARLEERGIITGYSVRLSDDYQQGLVRAHVLLTVIAKLSDRVVAKLRQMRAVQTVHSVSGSFDMIVIVEASSIRELDVLLDQIGSLEGVERTLSSIILSTRIQR